MRVTRPASLLEVVARQDAQILCFEYDYPDAAGLRKLQEVKRYFPHLPVIMLTLQHSEALAIWAFRTQVRDYLEFAKDYHAETREGEAPGEVLVVWKELSYDFIPEERLALKILIGKNGNVKEAGVDF